MKTFWYFIIAVVITFMAMVYQQKTGPTHPQKAILAMEGNTYHFSMPRSHGGPDDCPLEFTLPDTTVSGTITFRKYPTSDEWTTLKMARQNEKLSCFLPHQPPAGKLEYVVSFQKEGKTCTLNTKNATIIRFKGDVPAAVLVPHIFLMFLSMFFANLAGIMAIFRHKKFRFYSVLTIITLGLGGMVFGPWVQYLAFGEAWTGIPFAWDLTDNKTLIAFIFWIIAVSVNAKKEKPVYVILASLIMLIIFSIPHSILGSQLDPATGKIIQGFIHLPV